MSTWRGSNAQFNQFPERYVYGTAPSRIAAHLAAVRRFISATSGRGGVQRGIGTCEYTVVTHNDVTPGIFSKIAGVMAGSGVQILDAQILTRADGIVVDTLSGRWIPIIRGRLRPSGADGAEIGSRRCSKGWEHVDDRAPRVARG